MTRAARALFVVLTIAVVQTAVMPHARVAGVVPELGLVATAAIAYRLGPEAGAVFGFTAGLALDLFLSTPLGLSALAWGLSGYVIGILQSGLLRTAWWVAPLLGLVGGVLGGLLFVGIGALVGQDQLWALHSARIVGLAALYDGLVAPVVFPLVLSAVRSAGRALRVS